MYVHADIRLESLQAAEEAEIDPLRPTLDTNQEILDRLECSLRCHRGPSVGSSTALGPLQHGLLEL